MDGGKTNLAWWRKAKVPGGADNGGVILEACAWAEKIIWAWGGHGVVLARGAKLEKMLRAQNHALWGLGLTKAGHPKHPLYIGYGVQPTCWGDENKTG